MLDWIAHIIDQGGYLGLAFLMFLENVFPPIPSELVMPMAGYVSGQGSMSFWGAVIAGTIGSTVGQLPLYWLGRAWGVRRLYHWVENHGYWTAVNTDELDSARRRFHKYEAHAVFFFRMVPTLRSLISIPAGLAEMNMGLFLTLTAAGSFIWNLFLTAGGRLLGGHYDVLEHYLNPLSQLVVAGLIIGYLWKVQRNYRKAQQSD